MWNLITIGILVVLIAFLGIYVIRKERKRLDPIQAGMVVGGIAGILIGIMRVELWGYEYPLPLVLSLPGMAGGQITGWL